MDIVRNPRLRACSLVRRSTTSGHRVARSSPSQTLHYGDVSPEGAQRPRLFRQPWTRWSPVGPIVPVPSPLLQHT